MTTIAFKTEEAERTQLMRDAIQKDLNMSVILRRMLHLYLNDEETRRKVLDFERKDGWEAEF